MRTTPPTWTPGFLRLPSDVLARLGVPPSALTRSTQLRYTEVHFLRERIGGGRYVTTVYVHLPEPVVTFADRVPGGFAEHVLALSEEAYHEAVGRARGEALHAHLRACRVGPAHAYAGSVLNREVPRLRDLTEAEHAEVYRAALDARAERYRPALPSRAARPAPLPARAA